jgi:hypothetical protein
MLYCTPVCTANTIVPDGKAQVGCTMLLVVGVAGGEGTGSTVIAEALLLTHVVSAMLRTERV